MKTAIVIVIGDEILSGNTGDTNSRFIAQQLRNIGIKVIEVLTISDEIQAIEEALQLAAQQSNLIITTGGLGPTKDDKTKTAFSNFFDDKIIFSQELYDKLGKYLEKKGRLNLLDYNKNQCEVLSKAVIFDNINGTAPCQMLEKEGKLVFCLPGVPYEVKPFLKDQIIPYLKNKWSLDYIVERIISVVDIPESLLSEMIKDWELALPSNISLSYLPVGSRIKLRLTAVGKNKELLEHQITELIPPLKSLIGGNIISYSDDSIETILAYLLKSKKLTISTAESCTTGQLARLLTSVSGSSTYYIGGIIAYSSKMKVKLLEVDQEGIDKYTVVSREVAEEMTKACKKMFGSDIAIGTTGVSGPDKGEDGKDVGTIYYSIMKGDEVKNYHLYLPYLEREDFVVFASLKILESLIVWLEEADKKAITHF